MNRAKKLEIVAKLKEAFLSSSIVIVARNQGITVGEANSLRRSMRSANTVFCVTKNRLAKIALQGSVYDGLDSLFLGPTAIAYSADPVSAAKVIVDYAKTNKNIEILGGMMGDQYLDISQVQALASLPSLDELRGQLVGLISAPATKIARILQAPAGQLARVCGAYAEKGSQ